MATKKFLIGREQDCHLRPNSELVSRHHCVFAVDDFSVHVSDLGSTNGTFVNDQRVRGEVLLNSGDRIRVGKLDFELAIGEPVARSRGQQERRFVSAFARSVDRRCVGCRNGAARCAPTPLSRSPFPPVPEDTGSSIIADSATPVPAAPPAAPAAAASPIRHGRFNSRLVAAARRPDTRRKCTLRWECPIHRLPIQPAYPYMTPGMGYQPQYPYPQMPMDYPRDVSADGPADGHVSASGSLLRSAAVANRPVCRNRRARIEDTASSILNVRLPDPKTTGAKAALRRRRLRSPPPAPEAAAAACRRGESVGGCGEIRREKTGTATG